jgi:hypothetical protein
MMVSGLGSEGLGLCCSYVTRTPRQRAPDYAILRPVAHAPPVSIWAVVVLLLAADGPREIAAATAVVVTAEETKGGGTAG